MSVELTHEEIPEDAGLPATKHDLGVVRQEIIVAQTMIRDEVAKSEKRMRDEMREMRDEIFRHFDVAVENIEDSLRGANADEISLLKNNVEIHEERLGTVEERVGLR